MSRSTRSPRLTAIGLAGVLALSTGAAFAANPSSMTESRGYQQCVKAADREVQVIKMDADYYIYDHADTRQYYLNGYAFRNGASAPVKISCTTIRSGHRVLDLSVDQGRYAGRIVDGIDVAQN